MFEWQHDSLLLAPFACLLDGEYLKTVKTTTNTLKKDEKNEVHEMERRIAGDVISRPSRSWSLIMENQEIRPPRAIEM